MDQFRVRLFPEERRQKGFKAALKGIFGGKLGLKKGQKLDVEIGRLTEHDYNCVDVFRKGVRIGEIRKSGIDEMIEKGAFEAAHFAGYIDDIPQITITCLETHEYRDKPEYKAWRAKLKQEQEAEKQAREAKFRKELKKRAEKISQISDPVKRQAEYQSILDQTYRRRKDTDMRDLFKEVGLKHASEFETLYSHLKEKYADDPSLVQTFKRLPAILSEDGDHDKAIQITKKAIYLKLDDGTKGGFQARLKKLERKKKQK